MLLLPVIQFKSDKSEVDKYIPFDVPNWEIDIVELKELNIIVFCLYWI